MLAVVTVLLDGALGGDGVRGSAIYWWRSVAVMADEDAQLCEVVEAYIDENYMEEGLIAMQEGGMAELEAEIAEDVAQWCMQSSEESARRRFDVHQNDQRRLELLSRQAKRLNESKLEFGSVEYVELIKDRLETYQHDRRRFYRVSKTKRSSSDLPEISAHMWMQCAGYADGLSI